MKTQTASKRAETSSVRSSLGTGVPVVYNWGRWIVNCPSKDCLAAVQVDMGATSTACDCRDTQICTHYPFCGTLITLVWPENPEAIVEACAARPVPNRNWYPPETVDDLYAENELHGVTS